MKTAVLILNYNNCRDTLNCIESIERHNTAPIKIIVVDNASAAEQLSSLHDGLHQRYGKDLTYTDTTTEIKSLSKITLIANSENMGYARGNNIGLQAIYNDDEIDQVLILNNDILFTGDIIPALTHAKAKLADCGIISPVLLTKDQSDYDYTCARIEPSVWHMIFINLMIYPIRLFNKAYNPHKAKSLLTHDIPQESVIPIGLPSGSCMLIDKQTMHDIGSFDPNTFLYFEENILNKKIRKIGLRNYLLLSSRCIHLGAATTSRECANSWLMEVSKQSECYYVKRYSDVGIVTKALHKLSVKIYLYLFKIQAKMAKRS